MSASTNTVDVLLIVDADRLLGGAAVKDSVSLVVQRSLVDPNADTQDEQDGGDELWFDVKKGDNIRWRGTTLSRNFDKSVVITSVYAGNQPQGNTGGISPPQTLKFTGVPVAYLTQVDPPTFGSTPSTVTLWQATATDVGKLWYLIEFYLLDQDAQPINKTPYSWDPFITVTP